MFTFTLRSWQRCFRDSKMKKCFSFKKRHYRHSLLTSGTAGPTSELSPGMVHKVNNVQGDNKTIQGKVRKVPEKRQRMKWRSYVQVEKSHSAAFIKMFWIRSCNLRGDNTLWLGSTPLAVLRSISVLYENSFMHNVLGRIWDLIAEDLQLSPPVKEFQEF